MEPSTSERPSSGRIARPARDEMPPYYFPYVDRVPGDDILGVLAGQLEPTLAFLRGFSEEGSLYRYAPEKWSARQVLGHLNDTERLYAFRAFWFARGHETPLPSYESDRSVEIAGADEFPWAFHVEGFRAIRQATLSFFGSLTEEAWMRRGTASDYSFSVRSLAYIAAGHVDHHMAILGERYRPR